MEFFEASATDREVCFMAANRVGKTLAGAYATALHLTGEYPPWWCGRRLRQPCRAWVAGDTNETVKEIIQPVLFGQRTPGTGVIRASAIERLTPRRGLPDTVESCRLRNGSTLLLKSYEQGRKAFQGAKIDLIWLDEEPSMAIYSECLLRLTATTPAGDDWGLLLCTFTPLLGISEVVMHFMASEETVVKAASTLDADA
jgi:phage terminase large subunit-like protein